jgi:hypothetical protein
VKLPKGGHRPAFAQADGGNEAWVLLLEKAIAKHFGSYAGIEGGRADWLFKAMAGRHAEDHRRYFAAKASMHCMHCGKHNFKHHTLDHACFESGIPSSLLRLPPLHEVLC